jgi:hypothetical protein
MTDLSDYSPLFLALSSQLFSKDGNLFVFRLDDSLQLFDLVLVA